MYKSNAYSQVKFQLANVERVVCLQKAKSSQNNLELTTTSTQIQAIQQQQPQQRQLVVNN